MKSLKRLAGPKESPLPVKIVRVAGALLLLSTLTLVPFAPVLVGWVHDLARWMSR